MGPESGLLIRRASVADAAGFAQHFAEPAVHAGTLQMPHPAVEMWHKRLVDGTAVGGPEVLLVAERDGELVGHASLHLGGASPRRRHAMSLGIAVSGAAQGQGVGTALMAALCDYADRWAGVLRLELTVFADNEVAVRLYRNFGFEIEGTLRAYALRDGAYVDAYTMARLHPAPPTLPDA